MFSESSHLPCNSPRQFIDEEVDFSQWMINDLHREDQDLSQEEKVDLNDLHNPELAMLVDSFFCDSQNPSKKNEEKISLVHNLQSPHTSNLCYPQLTSHFFTVHGDWQLNQNNPKIYKTHKLTVKVITDLGSGYNRLALDECDFALHLLKFKLTGSKRTHLESENVIFKTLKSTVLSYEKVEFAFEGIDLSHIDCPRLHKPLYRFRFSICPWGGSDVYKIETDEFRVFSKKPTGLNVQRN